MTTRNLMKSYILRLLMVFVAGLLPIAGYSANIIAGTISGVVTGEKTGRAIGNAVIRVLDKSGQLVKSVVSNADGTFRVSNLPDGYYIIEAETESGGMAKVVEVIVNLQVPEEAGTAGATSAAPQAAKGGILVWTGKNWALIGGIAAAIGAGIGAGIVIENNDDDHDHRLASPSK